MEQLYDANYELQQAERKEMLKSNYAMHTAANKNQLQMFHQLELMKQKNILKEKERELQKSQVDVVKIRTDGTVIVQTENLRVDTKARYVVNAEFPSLTNVKKIDNDNHLLFLFEASINEKHVFTFLKADRISDGGYLLRKLGNIGVCVYADKQTEKKKLILSLIFCLREGEAPTLFLPESRGWYKDETGKIQFHEGKFTWQEAVECAQ